MKRIQVRIDSWMELKVDDDFDVNKLVGIENMNVEDVEEITGDKNWELIDIDTNYNDMRFIGDKIWVDDNCDNYFVLFDESSQSYKKRE